MCIVRLFRLLILATIVSAGVAANAADLKVEATLVWGSNSSNSVNHKALDAKRSKDLGRIFKWKQYYEITNCVATVAANATVSLHMSPQCELKVKNLDSSHVEVSWYGGGKLLMTQTKHALPLTLAGPDKNDSAYFMLLRAVDGHAAAEKVYRVAVMPVH